MTVTLPLKPELEAGLLAQAQAGGKTLEEYFMSMVEGAVVSGAGQTQLTPEKRPVAFEAWSKGHRSTPPLSDSAVSRESIYEDRDA